MTQTARDAGRVQFQVSIPAELRDRLREKAIREGRLLYRLVEDILREGVKSS